MSIEKNLNGYLIKDEKGNIHAKNIPTLKLAKFFKREITTATNWSI